MSIVKCFRAAKGVKESCEYNNIEVDFEHNKGERGELLCVWVRYRLSLLWVKSDWMGIDWRHNNKYESIAVGLFGKVEMTEKKGRKGCTFFVVVGENWKKASTEVHEWDPEH